jgi:hypothetical protein
MCATIRSRAVPSRNSRARPVGECWRRRQRKPSIMRCVQDVRGDRTTSPWPKPERRQRCSASGLCRHRCPAGPPDAASTPRTWRDHLHRSRAVDGVTTTVGRPAVSRPIATEGALGVTTSDGAPVAAPSGLRCDPSQGVIGAGSAWCRHQAGSAPQRTWSGSRCVSPLRGLAAVPLRCRHQRSGAVSRPPAGRDRARVLVDVAIGRFTGAVPPIGCRCRHVP